VRELVTDLTGLWPCWEARLGDLYVHIHIRWGHGYIGIGRKPDYDEDKYERLIELPDREEWFGVLSNKEVIDALKEAGFDVEFAT